MIGQQYIQNSLKVLVDTNHMPRFMLLVGDKGSGRRTVCKHIAHLMNHYFYIVPDVKIATVRDVIADAYKQKNEMIYIIPDIDTMSAEAQNAILKITEEPPNKVYFIMTVEDVNNILPTIKSRAYVTFMDKYTRDEIEQYSHETNKLTDVEIQTMVLDVCETPGEVNTFIACGGKKFYAFVDKVVENVDNVTIANLLKIAGSLDLKDDGKGYDVNLFLKVFMRCCMIHGAAREAREAYEYIQMIPPTSKALTRLKVKGANKNMILTDWLFDVRS